MTDTAPDQDAATQRWTDALRDGTPEQQAQARTELGLIFERRGMVKEAAEAYWANVKAKVRDRRPYMRLAAIYRQRGDTLSEARVLGLMDAVFASEVTTPPRRQHARVGLHRFGLIAMLTVVGVIAAVALVANVSGGLMSASKEPTSTPARSEPTWGVSIPASGVPSDPAPYDPESPVGRAIGTPTPIPAWCYTAEQRFPEWLDPESVLRRTVAELFREAGINPGNRGNPFTQVIVEAYDLPPDEAVAGWIVTSLYLGHRGEAALPFPEYVRAQGRYRLALGSLIKRMPPLRPIVSREGWSEMRSWPADSCDGAFLANPSNTRLVRLMEASFGDTTWLTPTPVGASPVATATQVPKPSVNLEQIVRDFYRAINERQYRDAYATLSRAAQATDSYADFERRFREARNAIEIRSVEPATYEASRASLVLHTTTTSQGTAAAKRECWRVEWRLILENGQWKRDSASQIGETC